MVRIEEHRLDPYEGIKLNEAIREAALKHSLNIANIVEGEEVVGVGVVDRNVFLNRKTRENPMKHILFSYELSDTATFSIGGALLGLERQRREVALNILMALFARDVPHSGVNIKVIDFTGGNTIALEIKEEIEMYSNTSRREILQRIGF